MRTVDVDEAVVAEVDVVLEEVEVEVEAVVLVEVVEVEVVEVEDVVDVVVVEVVVELTNENCAVRAPMVLAVPVVDWYWPLTATPFVVTQLEKTYPAGGVA